MNFPDLSSTLRMFSAALLDTLLLGGVFVGWCLLNEQRLRRRVPVRAARHERLLQAERIDSMGAER